MDERLEPIIEDLRKTYDLDAPDERIASQAKNILSMLEDLHGQKLTMEEVEAFFEDDDMYTGVAVE